MAAVLRQLLLDDLVHAANRGHRLPLVFTVTDNEPDPGAINWYMTSVIHPGTGKTRLPSVDLDLDDFLRRVPMVVERTPITVKDLIRFFANKEGGVHFDQSPSGTDAVLREWRPLSRMVTPSAQNARSWQTRSRESHASPLTP